MQGVLFIIELLQIEKTHCPESPENNKIQNHNILFLLYFSDFPFPNRGLENRPEVWFLCCRRNALMAVRVAGAQRPRIYSHRLRTL